MSGGFFNLGSSTYVPYKSQRGVHSCASCGLYKQAASPKIEPYGNFKQGILIVGEAPGEEEDAAGKPWQGRAGKALQRKCRSLGVDLFEDCLSVNAVNCRPQEKGGGNRAPTEYEIACCRQKVVNAIRRYKPKVVILLGGQAVSSVIGYKWTKDMGGITKWRGWTIPDRDFHAWVCPTFHPSFIIRQEEENEVDVIWTQDLERALAKVAQPFPEWEREEDCVEILDGIRDVLPRLRKSKCFAFDIETTGLKPYKKDIHKIVTISFCDQQDKAYVIPFPEEERDLALLRKLLENPRIGKIAANMKYEDTWLNVLHGIHVRPWVFDTMQAAHILDNRPGITGLKFQSFVRFGVLGYERDVETYLKSGSEPNHIMEMLANRLLFRKLMIYNGIDSLVEYRLACEQTAELGMDMPAGELEAVMV